MEKLAKYLNEAIASGEKFRAFEMEYQQKLNEQQYKNLKPLQKLLIDEKVERKVDPVRYILGNTVVVPLIFVKLITKEERVAVGEIINKELKQKSVQTISNMQKVQQDADMFSPGVLSSILAYMNFQCEKNTDIGQYIVIGRFVAVIYEITASKLREIHERIAANMKYGNVNIRVIKPFNPVYSLLMKIEFIFGIEQLGTVTPGDYINAVKKYMVTAWKPELETPVKFFLEVTKSLRNVVKKKDLLTFMELVKTKLISAWNEDIVDKCFTFTHGVSSI